MKIAFARTPATRRVVTYLKPYRGRVAVILGLTLLSAAAAALEPLLIKRIIEALSSGSDVRSLVTTIASLAGLALAREVVVSITNWSTWRTRLAIHFDLLDGTVERLQTLTAEQRGGDGVGGVMMRLDRAIQSFLGAFSDVAFQLLPAVLYLVMAVTVMFQLDWRLALLAVAFAPVPAFIAARAGTEQAERERTLLDLWSKIYSRWSEVLSGIVTVRSFAMEDAERKRFLSGVSSANQRVLRGVATDSRVNGLQGLSVAAARVSTIALGSWLVLRGEGTVATLVALLAYLNGLFGPVQGLSGIYGTLKRASVAVEHLYSLLAAHDPLADAPNAQRLPGCRGDLVFDNVSFAYAHDRPAILQGVSLHVRPGEHVAFVGPSGAGKSTLMSLVQRFQDPVSGAIRLDGIDLRQIAQKSLRQNIGVVLQEAVLFDDTIHANIAYGRPDASHAEIVAAARAAHAHDFINRLPKGYDTMVGERGKLLSGGERQRIAIARALLKNPSLLILDEATSALDYESENLVQQAIERLSEGRTTLSIAHRLSTVVRADRIVVIKDGRIQEMGRHEELLALGGYYAFLVKEQLFGSPPAKAA